MAMQAVRRIQFCAGHRLLGHEGGCVNLHGHNFVVFFHAEGDELDNIGRVIDFGVLKEKLGGWIDEHWDHGFFFCVEDREVASIFEKQIPNHKQFVLPSNPTVENMAQYLLEVVGPDQLERTGVHLVKVVLWETENCFSEVSL
jgi:6-pyruvoyltetrahydropterin/6-carboxytetrahydropterin synthase